MWKRLNNKGARQPAYDEPKYSSKGYTPHGLGIEIHSPTSPTDQSQAPPRPPRDDMEPKVLPSLPLELAPPSPPEYRNSKFRPASSIYSQPSPNPIVTRFPRNSYATPSTTYTEEVSPPSSPEFDGTRGIQRSQNQPKDEEVSPIDEMPDISNLGVSGSARPSSKQGSSNIPVLRREKRRNQVAAAAANLVTRKELGGGQGRPAKNPSWDPYSGEPTTSERGKKQTTKPGEFTPPGLRSVHGLTGQALGNSSTISAAPAKNISFGDRVRKLKGNTIPEEKPEWKGASGRVTLVPTTADRLDLPPLSVPQKSTKRVASPILESKSPVSPQSGGETDPASAQRQRNNPTIRAVLSDSAGNAPRRKNIPSAALPDPFVTDNGPRTQTRRDLPVETQTEESPSVEELKFRDNYKDLSLTAPAAPEPYIQPPSRFSISTYAPSEAQTTPRPSTDNWEPVPPMPTPPQSYTSNMQSSILDRTRPKVGPGPRGAHNVTRKAVNSSTPVFISLKSGNDSKRGSIASNIGKSLPHTPAEAESQDLISSLQAQLDDLAHRRNNITKGIRQMTELMPTDSIILTAEVRRKREDEKRKVEGLREEEADIRQQEHDIGLRLHRAWKRKDKEAVYEPTGLWVRRVTG